MAYITYSTSELETRVVRYKCCFANTGYSLLKSEQNQTDNKGCLTNKFNYLNQGIKTLERYIKKILPLQISFDFSDLEDLAYPITRTFQFYFNEGKLIEVIITGSSFSDFLDQILEVFNTYKEETGLTPVLDGNIIYLYLGCKSCTSSEILLVEGINSYWDLSDIPETFTSAYSFTVVNEDSTETIVDFPIQSYTSRAQLIAAIISQINSQGDFFAYSSGDFIYLQSLTDPGISVELTLSLTNPFEIQINPSFDPAPVTYQLGSTTLDSGNCSVYNPNDDTYWFIGQNSAGGGNIVICVTQPDGTLIKSTEDADYQVPFTYSRGVYDPNTKKIYITSVADIIGGTSGIAVLDADNLNMTYGEVIDFWDLGGESSTGNKILLHSDTNIYHFGNNTALDFVVYCLDNTGTVIDEINLGADSEYALGQEPFWEFSVEYNLDIIFSTKNRILKIDGDSSSPDYNTVIADLLIDSSTDYTNGSIVDNGSSLNFIGFNPVTQESKLYELTYLLDDFFEVINFTENPPDIAHRTLAFVNNLFFISGQGFYALYDLNYNLLSYEEPDEIEPGQGFIIYSIGNDNDEALFYNYYNSKKVGVFTSTIISYTYDLDIADITIKELNAELELPDTENCYLTDEYLNNLIENLNSICCDNCQDNLNLIKDIND